MSDDDRQIRPFAAWLQEQRAGATHAELTAALPELVEAVTTYGKAGELLRAAFADVLTAVETATTLTAFRGAPPA